MELRTLESPHHGEMSKQGVVGEGNHVEGNIVGVEGLNLGARSEGRTDNI